MTTEHETVDWEPTIQQMLIDPLIAQVNQADGVNDRSFAQLLQSAARILDLKTSALPPTTDGAPVISSLATSH